MAFRPQRRCAALTVMIALGICPAASSAGQGSVSTPRTEESRLNLDQARTYLLELINKDRAVIGRPPVQLDGIATLVGQKQAEEMVRMAALSHADLQGRLPVQRYTEAGGLDRVQENVSLFRVKTELDHPLVLDPAPTFSRAEIEAIEAGYFNEIPPNDGHRRNILRAEHTHVGIGLARGTEDDSGVIGTAEEFVDRFLDDLSTIPTQVLVGGKVSIRGKMSHGRTLSAVGISRGAEPSALTRSDFRSVREYSVPRPYIKVRMDDGEPTIKLSQSTDGSFTVTATLSDRGTPGLYYLSLWIDEPGHGEALASVRTVSVRSALSSGGGSADWKR